MTYSLTDLIRKRISKLRLKETAVLKDLNDFSTREIHRTIIQSKPFLKKIYEDYYLEFANVSMQCPGKGIILELGSGSGFLKETIPSALTSEISFTPTVDLALDATQLPFRDESIRSVLLLGVLHHIKTPILFFEELERCLEKHGRVFMVEPHNTPWSRYLLKNFHHELFDTQAGWTTQGDGHLSDANQALPWIIFYRDRKRFEKDFPGLKIRRLKAQAPLRYVLSGGLSLKTLVPDKCYNLIKAVEWVLQPLGRLCGYSMIIELEKI
ncbi:MAG: class I SAM-dependent methyltransferase [Candidatus Nitrohelix vancouverensis]|uniref:Class I SAM-dependent methyltransferase n=1 Tax=Candidatus Nitrohelix vancouverensis TaxID=2705534 RepID=A0A7T0C2D3_9BACT|nr:MAG: class I SAM-dependent methyltransferase [Candidatus Nitrohelix vancouverensis]